MEPINGRAVDDGWELAAAEAQGVADGREAEDDLEEAPNAVNEEGPTVRVVVFHPGFLDGSAHAIDDVLLLVGDEKVGDLTGGEQVVDEDEELLVGNLGVRHEEHDALGLLPRLDKTLG